MWLQSTDSSVTAWDNLPANPQNNFFFYSVIAFHIPYTMCVLEISSSAWATQGGSVSPLFCFPSPPRSFEEDASGSLSLHGALNVRLQQEDGFVHLDLTGIQLVDITFQGL